MTTIVLLHLYRVVDDAPVMLCGTEPSPGGPTIGLHLGVYLLQGASAVPPGAELCAGCRNVMSLPHESADPRIAEISEISAQLAKKLSPDLIADAVTAATGDAPEVAVDPAFAIVLRALALQLNATAAMARYRQLYGLEDALTAAAVSARSWGSGA